VVVQAKTILLTTLKLTDSMSQVQVQIKKSIYIRKGAGRSYASIGIAQASGDIITMDGIEQGESWKGITDWYYKINNNNEKQYYWGGGIVAHLTMQQDSMVVQVAQPPFLFNQGKMSWAHESVANGGLGIVDLWNAMGVRGVNVKVAVIDTGATSANNDLKGKIDLSLSKDCESLLGIITDTDGPEFHGTKSAGIIAANGGNSNTVYGVAPDCQLVVYRLFANQNLQGYTDTNFCFALRQARKAKVDIISMSFEMLTKPQGIDVEIQACLDANILLVASAGDNKQMDGIKNNFPASLTGCISIGAYQLINKIPTVYTDHSSKSDFLFCLGPGDNILTTGIDSSPVYHQYTSAAAPFVSGIIALMLSYRKKMNLPVTADLIKTQLKNSCDRINKTVLKDEIEGYGVINPTTLFNLLKT